MAFKAINNEYLQGGNPLDFNFGKASSVSVQSTSLADQQPEPFVTRYHFLLVLLSHVMALVFGWLTFYCLQRSKR